MNFSRMLKAEISLIQQYIMKEVTNVKCADKNFQKQTVKYFETPGKMIRPAITVLASKVCNKTEKSINTKQLNVCAFSQMIHCASLIHDDIIDKSDVRRGLTTVHVDTDNSTAVHCGNYIMGTAANSLAKLNDAHVIKLLSRAINDLIDGELLQMQMQEDNKQDLFDTYIEKCFLKTASLLASTCEACSYLSEEKNNDGEWFEFGRNIGVAFQIVDDILDVTSAMKGGSELGKPAGTDMAMGVYTAPLLFAMQRDEEFGVLQKNDKDFLRKAQEAIVKTDSINSAYALAQKFMDKANVFLDEYEDSEAKRELQQICSYVIGRSL